MDRADAAALADEYKLAMNRFDDMDRRIITIKGWTFAGGLVGLAQPAIAHDTAFLVFAIVIFASGWWFEGTYKAWQNGQDKRMEDIEIEFQRLQPEFPAFQILHSMRGPIQNRPPARRPYEIYGDRTNIGKTLYEMSKHYVMFPYVLFIAFCLFRLFVA